MKVKIAILYTKTHLHYRPEEHPHNINGQMQRELAYHLK